MHVLKSDLCCLACEWPVRLHSKIWLSSSFYPDLPVTDEKCVALIREWIAAMEPAAA
jgi:hypothetical protein